MSNMLSAEPPRTPARYANGTRRRRSYASIIPPSTRSPLRLPNKCIELPCRYDAVSIRHHSPERVASLTRPAAMTEGTSPDQVNCTVVTMKSVAIRDSVAIAFLAVARSLKSARPAASSRSSWRSRR